MCQKKECKYIQIVEYDEKGSKVYIHYDKDYRPVLIQYYSKAVGKCLDFEENLIKII
jgi:hypothetical protein